MQTIKPPSLGSTQPQDKLDYGLISLLAGIMFVGLVMLFSASVSYAEMKYGNEFFFLIRQSFAIFIGLIAAYIAYQIPLSLWIRKRGYLLLFSLVLLVLVLLIGTEINGSKRWLPLGIFNFQPSELMKFTAIVFMAAFLTIHKNEVEKGISAIFRLSLPFGLMAFLLFLEPDFGSIFVVAMILAGMLLISGAPLSIFVVVMMPLFLFLGLFFIQDHYRIERMLNFYEPWQDPFGVGYQLIQALIAQGSGGWTGVGLGQSVQKMLYLPDAHTDFIISIFAEEFGFIGILLLLMTYMAIIYKLFRIADQAKRANYQFGALFVYGVSFWVALQIFINVGSNFGLMPTKGLTLPLFSYGGSSMILFLIAFAVVLKIEHVSRFYPDPKNSDDYDEKQALEPEVMGQSNAVKSSKSKSHNKAGAARTGDKPVAKVRAVSPSAGSSNTRAGSGKMTSQMKASRFARLSARLARHT
ncbi:putative lipid II flippase FtsW [Thiosulfatimonas sediminis]|uniref:Probable peptidoglycan glycosyltransferase FtsW n=1 Tax=Thiosulfatimonas sediminis TaxID=2675054 RepID=A0A6F8PWN1_9GAMM|nr:putative lipid II flippase FtsW [Thiosulfatimonas sediminis]BBP46553.1 putative lipid II flippase FtsW [Thiosulfatimonas sediminis]